MTRWIGILLILILIVVACASGGGDEAINRLSQLEQAWAAADAAYGGDPSIYVARTRKLLNLSPNHPRLLLRHAGAQMNAGMNRRVLKTLSRLVDIKTPLANVMLSDSLFAPLYGLPEFEALKSRLNENNRPVIHSEAAFLLEEKKLIPEGVAWDPVDSMLYVSSLYLRKIVAVDPKGNVTDFIPSKKDDILAVIGMEVDPVRRRLWACTGWDGRLGMVDFDRSGGIRGTLYEFDLNTREIVRTFTPQDSGNHLCNDVTIARNGTVYFTDTFAGAVYEIPEDTGELTSLIPPGQLIYPNGLALAEEAGALLVACYDGIWRVDLRTRQFALLKHPADVCLVNIDGLELYRGWLIAHQGSTLGGVWLYKMNEKMDRVKEKRPLDVNHPQFNFPTTGEIAGSNYYYIANAQIRAFHANGQIFDDEWLKPVTILKADLDQVLQQE